MREAVGLSLMVLVMGILRRLLFGRISRKMQYALWLSVLVFLVLSLFVRIPVTVRPLAGTESTEQIVSGNLQEAAGAAASEGMTAAATANEADSAQAEGMQDGMEIPAGREEIDRAGQAWPGESGTGFGWRLVNGTLRLGMRAAALLNTAGFAAFAGGIRAVGRGAAAALLLYNLFFALYCRRHRRLLGTDPETGLRVYRLRRTGSPFLLGRSVYVPSQTASDRELLYYAVLHEYCHFLQGDSLWPVVRHLILMMNWYNPLAWIAFRMAEQDSELACDERVLDRLGDGRRTEYGEVLIRKMRNRNTMPQFPCATTRMLGDRRRLRERITCISRRSARSVKLFAAGALCMVLVTGCALVSPGAPGTMTAEQTEAAEAQTTAEAGTAADLAAGSAQADGAQAADEAASAAGTAGNAAGAQGDEAQAGADSVYPYMPGHDGNSTIVYDGKVYYADREGIRRADLSTGTAETVVAAESSACLETDSGWLYYQTDFWNETKDAELCRMNLQTGDVQTLLPVPRELQSASVFVWEDDLYLFGGVPGSATRARGYLAYHLSEDGTAELSEESPVGELLETLEISAEEMGTLYYWWLPPLLAYHKLVRTEGEPGKMTLYILDADGADPVRIDNVSGNVYSTFMGLVYQDTGHSIHLQPWEQTAEGDSVLVDYQKEQTYLNYGPCDQTGIYGFVQTADQTVITRLGWDGTLQELEDVTHLGDAAKLMMIRLSCGDGYYCYYDEENGSEVIRKAQ